MRDPSLTLRMTLRVIARSFATKQSTRLKRILLDCFASARNDEKYLLSNPLLKIRPCNDRKKSFFGFHPQNDIAKKAAFTLAEVLLTFGIIGVVAALTLPGLLAEYSKVVVETKLKNFYSQINQAVQLSKQSMVIEYTDIFAEIFEWVENS